MSGGPCTHVNCYHVSHNMHCPLTLLNVIVNALNMCESYGSLSVSLSLSLSLCVCVCVYDQSMNYTICLNFQSNVPMERFLDF